MSVTVEVRQTEVGEEDGDFRSLPHPFRSHRWPKSSRTCPLSPPPKSCVISWGRQLVGGSVRARSSGGVGRRGSDTSILTYTDSSIIGVIVYSVVRVSVPTHTPPLFTSRGVENSLTQHLRWPRTEQGYGIRDEGWSNGVPFPYRGFGRLESESRTSTRKSHFPESMDPYPWVEDGTSPESVRHDPRRRWVGLTHHFGVDSNTSRFLLRSTCPLSHWD